MTSGLEPGPRSIDLLDWITRVGASPTMTAGAALGMSRPTVYDHARRLVEFELLHRVGGGVTSGLLVPTRRGCARVGREWVGARRMVPAQWEHATALADVAAWLSTHPDVRWWRSEREMNSTIAPESSEPEQWVVTHTLQTGGRMETIRRRPDVVADLKGAVTAIEVERSRKARERLRAIVSAWGAALADGRVDQVLYMTGDASVQRAVVDAREFASQQHPQVADGLLVMQLEGLPIRPVPAGHLGTGGSPDAEPRPGQAG